MSPPKKDPGSETEEEVQRKVYWRDVVRQLRELADQEYWKAREEIEEVLSRYQSM